MQLQELAALAIEHKVQFQIGITVEKGMAVVTVVPKTAKNWPPFTIKGAPEVLDEEWATHLAQLTEAVAVIGNAATYVEQVKKEAAKAAKDLLSAIEDRQHGVLQCLSKYW